ncbi:hypothetical protein [Acidovorax radicis]|uniref:hypothetical protein n=1 Tax=Acidovorax radicis TaxID=758826 RepID=UPI000237522B|nr:hypothetical protein [Acidovorax radicis]
MNETVRPLVRQRSLKTWASAIEQQPRVWLPLQLLGQGVGAWSVFWGTAMAGVVLWVQALFLLDLRGMVALACGLLICCCVAGATLSFRRAQQRDRRRGWEVDFQRRTLTPVGLAQQQAIDLGAEHSLGCYLNGGDSERSLSFQLELRHARKGPIAALTVVQLQSGNAADVEILNRCVNRLVERLGIRRSGAPLLAQKAATKRASYGAR